MDYPNIFFNRWVRVQTRYGRYIDPFSVSIDVKRSRKSLGKSFLAIDDIRLVNCEPGTTVCELFLGQFE
jgi:hypothetical protein